MKKSQISLVAIVQINAEVVLGPVFPIPARQPDAESPKQHDSAPQLCITRKGTAVSITSASSEYRDNSVSGMEVTSRERANVQATEPIMEHFSRVRILPYCTAPKFCPAKLTVAEWNAPKNM